VPERGGKSAEGFSLEKKDGEGKTLGIKQKMASDYSRKDPDNFLDLEDTQEELGDKVQQVRAELENLKQKQEEIEREKSRLEELKRRQDELETGRSEMLDKLTRGLVVVQREVEGTQTRLEQLHVIHNAFTQHVRGVEAINPRGFGTADLPRELSKALSAVEDARADYVKAQAKLAADSASDSAAQLESMETDYSEYEDRGFTYWLKSGFAFTLPLQILGVLALMIWIWAVLSAAK
jgi:DNA repair exonuclease SbcCD ATPase subunit